MHLVLLDTRTDHVNLQPFTFTRPVSHIRCGVVTLAEKWSFYGAEIEGLMTTPEIQALYPLEAFTGEVTYVRSSVLPDEELVQHITGLKPGQCLFSDTELIACCSPALHNHYEKAARYAQEECEIIQYNGNARFIRFPWDIFSQNAACIDADIQGVTRGRKSEPISTTNNILGEHTIFLEEGVTIEACILNATEGPIYLGKNSEVMEGSMIRGPFALCESSVLKMGTKIYSGTTVGPHCKIGGEVNNSVIFGYSNKAHDGFLGNSVIGEWCNLGADTNNSNLKNNYGDVKVWNYREQRMIDTYRQFCGVFMGDHSKTGINTMLNTGTVVGVSANIYGGDFPPKHVPSFSWGGASGLTRFELPKALDVARKMMERRGLKMRDAEEQLLRHIYALSAE